LVLNTAFTIFVRCNDYQKNTAMKKYIVLVFLFAIFSLSIISCRPANRFAIDLSNPVEVNIQRFDKDFILLDTLDIVAGVKQLYEKYPDFFPVFIHDILGLNPHDTLFVAEQIGVFLTDSLFRNVNKEALKQFEDVRDIEHKLSIAFTYLQYYFPEIKLPRIYFFVSGFNSNILLSENLIGMGTDMYLGTDFEAYLKSDIYRYKLEAMNRQNLAPDLISALLFYNFRMRSEQDRLIDHMLYRGKIMFLLSVIMPNVSDEFLIGYSAEQIQWSRRFERQIWTSIIDQKALFSTDRFLIRQFLNDAPFTSPISPDSPGRLGTWIGWQIVRSYMNRNQQITLEELMRTTDFQRILEESGYRP